MSPKRLLLFESFTCNEIKASSGLGVVRSFKVGEWDLDCGKVSVIGGEIEEDKTFEVLQKVDIVELTCEQIPTTIDNNTDGPKRDIVKTLTFKVDLQRSSGINAVKKLVSKFDVLKQLKIDEHGNVSIKGEAVSAGLLKCMEKVGKIAGPYVSSFGDGSLNSDHDEDFNV